MGLSTSVGYAEHFFNRGHPVNNLLYTIGVNAWAVAAGFML